VERTAAIRDLDGSFRALHRAELDRALRDDGGGDGERVPDRGAAAHRGADELAVGLDAEAVEGAAASRGEQGLPTALDRLDDRLRPLAACRRSARTGRFARIRIGARIGISPRAGPAPGPRAGPSPR